MAGFPDGTAHEWKKAACYISLALYYLALSGDLFYVQTAGHLWAARGRPVR